MANTDDTETMHMRTASKLILAALAATALLALTVGGASARNLRVTERNFEFIWNEALGGTKTQLEFIDGLGLFTRCKVTFLGSFVESTIAKQTTTKIAEIRHADRPECLNGTEAAFMNFPWNVFYRGFTGTLPRITSVSIGVVGLTTRIREAGLVECTARTEAMEPAVFILEGIEAAGGVENVSAEENTTIRINAAECPTPFRSPLRFRGKGLVRNLPRSAKITLTLI